jgi:hypothetical protein
VRNKSVVEVHDGRLIEDDLPVALLSSQIHRRD